MGNPVIRPFTERAPCEKCGHEFSEFEHRPDTWHDFGSAGSYKTLEHMLRKCPRCKFTWVTDTKDGAASKARPAYQEGQDHMYNEIYEWLLKQDGFIAEQMRRTFHTSDVTSKGDK